MKKNLSSKAIKSMAIGLSIAMGTGTGVSGVMVNTHTVKADITMKANGVADALTDATATMETGKNDIIKIIPKTGGAFVFTGSSDTTAAYESTTATDFTVTVNDGTKDITGYTVKSAEITSKTGDSKASSEAADNYLKITLNKPVLKDDKISISYKASTQVLKYNASSGTASVASSTKVSEILTSKSATSGLESSLLSTTGNTVKFDNSTATAPTVTIKLIDGLKLGKDVASISSNIEDYGIVIKKKGDAKGTNLAKDKLTSVEYKEADTTITLKFKTALDEGDYTFSYDRSKDTQTSAVGFLNTTGLKNVPTGEATFTVDTTAPTLTTAEFTETDVTKPTVTLTASEKLGVQGTAPDEFTIKDSKSDLAGTFTAGTINANDTTIKLTGSAIIPKAGKYTVNYKAGTNKIKDLAGNEMVDGTATFTIPETNVTANTSKDGKTITITLPTGFVDSKTTGATVSEFTITKGKNPITAKSINVDDTNHTITLTLNKKDELKYGDNVTVAYNPTTTTSLTTMINNNKSPLRINSLTVDNNVSNPSEIPTTNGYTVVKHTDGKTASLVGYTPSPKTRSAKPTSTLENGTFKDGNDIYTITTVGGTSTDGTDLKNITDKDLQEHINEVEIIEANAFNGNKVITNLSFPRARDIKIGAFEGTKKLKSLELGTKSGARMTIADGAFKDAFDPNGATLRVQKEHKGALEDAINKDNPNVDMSKFNFEQPSTDNNHGNDKHPDSVNSGSYSSGSVAILNDSKGSKEEGTVGGIEKDHVGEYVPNLVTKELTFDAISLPSISGESKLFGDVTPTFWAAEHIDKLSKADIINGLPNGTFAPSNNIKRADVTIMITKLLGVTNENTTSFNDVDPQAYYADEVAALREYGIVKGSNGDFKPEDQITRQDTMVMIGQILKNLSTNSDSDVSALSKFGDTDEISSYATEYVAILVNSGIISGDNNNNLNPKKAVTRAEMATIMSKLYDLLNELDSAQETTTVTEESTETTTVTEESTETTTVADESTESTTEESTEK